MPLFPHLMNTVPLPLLPDVSCLPYQHLPKHLGPNLQAEGLEGKRVTKVQTHGWKIRVGWKGKSEDCEDRERVQ